VRRSIVVAVAASLLWLVALPAHAAVSVTVTEFRFSPATITVPQGEDVAWQNGGHQQHTSTQTGALALWSTGHIAVGATSGSFRFLAAGSYAYHCAIHTFMHGTVIVPIVVSPLRGTKKTTFTIRLASAAQAGFTYDVQRRVGAGPWTTWKVGVASITVRFKHRRGAFAFRSRLHRISNGATSGWSLPRAITIR
jgi:plastocyanin